MSEKYDCTEDVLDHKRRVSYWMNDFSDMLKGRAVVHDDSKLRPPEKECFDKWTPQLRVLTFGSEEYKQALAGMGEGLVHHYQVNRHHPEHYPEGVDEMTLYDLVEMVCDWMAAAEKKGVTIDLTYAAKRFNLSPQLARVIWNTFKDVDFITSSHNVPITNFATDQKP